MRDSVIFMEKIFKKPIDTMGIVEYNQSQMTNLSFPIS